MAPFTILSCNEIATLILVLSAREHIIVYYFLTEIYIFLQANNFDGCLHCDSGDEL